MYVMAMNILRLVLHGNLKKVDRPKHVGFLREVIYVFV